MTKNKIQQYEYVFTFLRDFEDYRKGQKVYSDIPTAVHIWYGRKNPRDYRLVSVIDLEGIISKGVQREKFKKEGVSFSL